MKSKNAKKASVQQKLADGRKVNKLFAKGKALVDRGAMQESLPFLLEAWDLAPDNLNILTVVGYVLGQLGLRLKAIEVRAGGFQKYSNAGNMCSGRTDRKQYGFV